MTNWRIDMVKIKEKIIVAMSGGVDSSVAAALLLRDGYGVTGVFVVNYDEPRIVGTDNTDKCWLPDYRDAVRVAAKLGIPLLKWDFTKEYNEKVLDYMYKEYRKGRTPNPDVLCNKFIKFGAWLDRAKKEGFDKLATGHYASLREQFPISNLKFPNKYPISNIQYLLLQAKDENKDQTYFLHQLTQKQLAHVMFPIGGYLKSEVRKLAHGFGLPTAEKEESMGICFIGEVPMKKFLQTEIKTKTGDVVLSDGTVVGEHDGLPFYTIGQRNLGKIQDTRNKTQNTKPLFVIGKDTKHNRLIVGHEDDSLLYKKQIRVTSVNWISGCALKMPFLCEVRLRHRQPLQKAKVVKSVKSKIIVEFKNAQRAPTPGQFAVLYQNGVCLGGGTIQLI